MSSTSTPDLRGFLATALATGGGVGLIRPGPGTWGSVAAAVSAWAVIGAVPIGWLTPTLAILAVLAALACLWSSTVVCARLGRHDPGCVVLDEIAGVWAGLAVIPAATLAAQPISAAVVVLALFRILDIAKPWPVSGVERLPGAWGILADDIVAGLVAGLASLPFVL